MMHRARPHDASLIASLQLHKAAHFETSFIARFVLFMADLEGLAVRHARLTPKQRRQTGLVRGAIVSLASSVGTEPSPPHATTEDAAHALYDARNEVAHEGRMPSSGMLDVLKTILGDAFADALR